MLDTLEKTLPSTTKPLQSEQATAPTGEDVFYSTFKWQFIDEKILDRINKEKTEGVGLSFLKFLAAMPSMGCIGAACLSVEYSGIMKFPKMIREWNSFDFEIKQLLPISLFIAGLGLVIAPIIVNSVGKGYKTREAQYRVFTDIAKNVDKYQQYIPEELIPLFVKMKSTSEEEIRKILPRLSKYLEQSVAQAIPNQVKTNFEESLKNFLDFLFIASGYTVTIASGIAPLVIKKCIKK